MKGSSSRLARGATMIEILVALVVTLFGLFALLGVNMRAYRAESESYQRSQALILVDDMAQRIKANRAGVADYAPATVGGGAVEDCDGMPLGAARDICEWGNLLRGATEIQDGNRVGAMADARGCLVAVDPGPALAAVGVVVVWRGTSPSAGAASAPCVPAGYSTTDGLLRYTSTVVGFGVLN